MIAIFSHHLGVMGYEDGKLIHSSKEDFHHFREMTKGHVLIMGSKSVDALPKKLEHRTVVALTNNAHYNSGKCDFFGNLEQVLDIVKMIDERNSELPDKDRVKVFVSGGRTMDALAEHIREAYITVWRNVEERNDSKPVVVSPKVASMLLTSKAIENWQLIKQIPNGEIWNARLHNEQ